MLYDRWRQIASQYPNEFAVRETASERRWTFAELERAADTAAVATDPVIYPRGQSIEFILAVLGAWRSGRVVCPLELGQPPPSVPNPPEWCAHLKLTSATTGPPRAVAFTADQIMADARNIVATMELRPDWPNLGTISMAHSYGFSSLVLPLLLHGIPLVVVPAPLPEAIRRAADGEMALTLPAVPALWRAWHEANAIPSEVRLAISAGAPLPATLQSAVFKASGVRIHNFYGSSECGGIAYDRRPELGRDETCAGTVLDGVEVSIGDHGCLEVRGSAVGTTYWPIPSPDLEKGRFRTSDLAELQDERVYLRGRSSDVINVAGRKVAPESVEEALARHPAITACLVFGVPDRDADRGEYPVTAILARAPVSIESLRQFLLERLPAWQIPRAWWFVESLPPNERGKLSRVEWRKKFLETPAGNNEPAAERDSVEP